MRKAVLAAMLLLSSISLFAQATPELKAEQHKATYTIIMIGKGREGGGCSSVAIAEHVLLTAAHCDVDNGTLYIDQTWAEYSGHALNHPLRVSDKFYDHQDHMLLVVPDVSFKHFVTYDPDNYKPLIANDRYYFWGNPALIQDQYREGYVTGKINLPPEHNPKEEYIDVSSPFFVLSGPVVGGDSGSGVFAANGRLAGVVSYGLFDGAFTGVYPLAFTAEQVAQAKGLGNYTYIVDPRPQVNVGITVPSIQVISGQKTPPKDYSIHILLICLFLAYKFRSVLKHLGIAASFVRRALSYALSVFKAVWQAAKEA
jgi:hypothetical protein